VKRLGILTILLFTQLLFIPAVSAGEYDWLNNLNILAKADSSGYRIRLATRFHIGNAEVNAVVSNVDKFSDAYMILRIGELSHRPLDDVIKVYRVNRNKGWGVMAKNLGIKPGSSEFHALKRGHDLDYASDNNKSQSSGKSNGKGKNKNKKNKGKK